MDAPESSWLDTSTTEDLELYAITLQDVRDYLEAAGEEEWTVIWAGLVPDTREASKQATLLQACRSFPSQTAPPTFTMSQSPDGSSTLEHTSIHIRILDPLTHRE